MCMGVMAQELPGAETDTSWFIGGAPEWNLIRASEMGSLEIVRLLVERGVDVDASTPEGVTPLMFAAQNGDTAMIRYLLAQGADIEEEPLNEVPPLMAATRTGQLDAVKILLRKGAEPDARDEFDLTSLMHAAAYNYPEIVSALIDAGADPEAGDWFGTRPLMIAAYYDCYESAKVLIERGADINAQDTFGFTALMIAAQHGDYDMAWLLLDAGADHSIRNGGELHALAIAARRGDRDMVELLVENGADVNQPVNQAINALSLAKEAGQDEMVSYLIELGARQNRAPEIGGIRGGFILNFNQDDFMLGFEGGISERKYRLYATSGMLFRPGRTRVLRSENESLAFQLWEKRYAWLLTLGKSFPLIQGGLNREFGARLHLTGMLTWGNYRGSSLRPGAKYLPVPGAGLYFRRKHFGINFDYQYVPLKINDIAAHRFSLTFSGLLDLSKRLRFMRKDISWF